MAAARSAPRATVDERVVEDGRVITGAGVTAGLDLALVLADHLCGRQIAEAMQLSAHYDPRPPFPPRHHATASADVLAIIDRDLGPREEPIARPLRPNGFEA